jgi:hypothetical protein
MDTSASPLQASGREALTALGELRRHEQFLVGSWRELVDTAQRRLERWESDERDHLSLRAARAAAATAAAEAAQAARFDAQLLKRSPQELGAARAGLESQIDSLRASQAEAAAHLDVAVESVLGELARRLACRGEAGARMRYATRVIDDLARAMRAYGDRVEQILLDLGDAVRAAFGLSMGAALPTRVPREPPRTELSGANSRGAVAPLEEAADAVWASVQLFRERVDGLTDDAIRALRLRLGTAAEQQYRSAEGTSEQVGQLLRTAQALDKLAERLDWMLPTDCGARTRR